MLALCSTWQNTLKAGQEWLKLQRWRLKFKCCKKINCGCTYYFSSVESLSMVSFTYQHKSSLFRWLLLSLSGFSVTNFVPISSISFLCQQRWFRVYTKGQGIQEIRFKFFNLNPIFWLSASFLNIKTNNSFLQDLLTKNSWLDCLIVLAKTQTYEKGKGFVEKTLKRKKNQISSGLPIIT